MCNGEDEVEDRNCNYRSNEGLIESLTLRHDAKVVGATLGSRLLVLRVGWLLLPSKSVRLTVLAAKYEVYTNRLVSEQRKHSL